MEIHTRHIKPRFTLSTFYLSRRHTVLICMNNTRDILDSLSFGVEITSESFIAFGNFAMCLFLKHSTKWRRIFAWSKHAFSMSSP